MVSIICTLIMSCFLLFDKIVRLQEHSQTQLGSLCNFFLNFSTLVFDIFGKIVVEKMLI